MGVMSLAHLTLPTREVEKTVAFFETTLGYVRLPVPTNSPVELVWLDIGRGQVGGRREPVGDGGHAGQHTPSPQA